MKQFGLKVSQAVVGAVGNWWFIFTYLVMLGAWITLHRLGILTIDDRDMAITALCVEAFAGAQASIILMHERHQMATDRRRDNATHKITKLSATKIGEISRDIGMIEGLLEDLAEEVTDET